MITKPRDLLDYVSENDVKFIKLSFIDLFGRMKNISVLADELKRVIDGGASIDTYAIKGLSHYTDKDLYLYPDLSTASLLPWRPQQGRVARVLCDIADAKGVGVEESTRKMLKDTLCEAKKMGITFDVGFEIEFYLFKLDDNGEPTMQPLDHAGYLDAAPFDKGENIRREITLTMEKMGIVPECSHHEMGPGQNEIVVKHMDAMKAADSLVILKSLIRTIAQSHGLHASFFPKPLARQTCSGLHIHISAHKNGKNLFEEKSGGAPVMESFIAGILENIVDMSAYLNPHPNSYARIVTPEFTPRVGWSYENRSDIIRIIEKDGEHARMELRSVDCAANGYLALSLLFRAGLLGIASATKLLPTDEWEAEHGVSRLPMGLMDAIEIARESMFIKNNVPESLSDVLYGVQKKACAVDKGPASDVASLEDPNFDV